MIVFCFICVFMVHFANKIQKVGKNFFDLILKIQFIHADVVNCDPFFISFQNLITYLLRS